MFSNEIVYTGSVEYVTTYTTSSETVERSNKFDYFVRITSFLTRFDYYIIITIYLFICTMDLDKLISLVYENRCLWDMSEKNYHNRDISRQKWEKVATELNTSSKYNF